MHFTPNYGTIALATNFFLYFYRIFVCRFSSNKESLPRAALHSHLLLSALTYSSLLGSFTINGWSLEFGDFTLDKTLTHKHKH